MSLKKPCNINNKNKIITHKRIFGGASHLGSTQGRGRGRGRGNQGRGNQGKGNPGKGRQIPKQIHKDCSKTDDDEILY